MSSCMSPSPSRMCSLFFSVCIVLICRRPLPTNTHAPARLPACLHLLTFPACHTATGQQQAGQTPAWLHLTRGRSGPGHCKFACVWVCMWGCRFSHLHWKCAVKWLLWYAKCKYTYWISFVCYIKIECYFFKLNHAELELSHKASTCEGIHIRIMLGF